MTYQDKDILNPEFFTNNSADNPVQRIKVIGVGGGGNNAVMHMYRQGIKDVSFVLLNTDRQVLDSLPVPTKVLIGPGRGAGGNPERARQLAEDSAERIAELFEDSTDMVFITAGMGGGTGTGAGPVVARIAKERGILTVGIVTLPFQFEGRRKAYKALEGAEQMAKNVDSLLIINNQRLAEIYRELDIFNAFAKADDTLLNAAQSITDIITQQGIINRDFNDVDTTLRDGGTAIISTGYGTGPNRVTAAIEDALHSPLLRNTDIFSSKKLLMVLYVSDDKSHPFNMEETRALDEFVQGIDKGDIDVMWGLYRQSDLKDEVRITILASGFESPGTTKETKKTETAPPKDSHLNDYIDGIYGPGNTTAISGYVLAPDAYDNPDDPELRQLENNPAIDRSPYKKYMHGMTGAHSFRGNIGGNNEPAPRETDNDTPAANSNGLSITFDDID